VRCSEVSRRLRFASTRFALPGFGPGALVGSFAVTTRPAAVHSATNDVDAVSDADATADALVEVALSRGGRDKVAVVVAHISG